MRYAIVNAANQTVGLVEWDGATPFDPGPGLRLVPADQASPYRPDLAQIRVRDIFNRLPDAKRQTIWQTAIQTPALFDQLQLLVSGDYVDRADPRLTSGFATLVAAGLLTQADVDAAFA